MVSRLRVAVVRGAHLNPFEMQTYVALQPQFDLTAFATHDNLYDLSQLGLPIRRLHRPKELGFDIPHWRGFCNVAARLLFASEERMLGLERALARYDLVHAVETYNYFSWQAVQAKAKTGVPVVLTVWDNIPHNYEDIPRYARCKSAVRAQADLFLAITEQARTALIEEGVDASMVYVVGAGVDVVRFHPGPAIPQWRERFGLAKDEIVVLFVGSLIHAKGVHVLLAAAQVLLEANLLQRGVHRILIVGEGSELTHLRAFAQRTGLARFVTFGGSASYADMPAIHRLADIFVLPSIPTPTWEEQFGMVLVESMATGKAVVSTRSGSIPEVVGDAGVLVSPGDPGELAQTLGQLLRDETLRNGLGHRARLRTVSTYAHDIVAERIADAYRSVLRI